MCSFAPIKSVCRMAPGQLTTVSPPGGEGISSFSCSVTRIHEDHHAASATGQDLLAKGPVPTPEADLALSHLYVTKALLHPVPE